MSSELERQLALSAGSLRAALPPGALPASTAEIAALDAVAGQDRAQEAMLKRMAAPGAVAA